MPAELRMCGERCINIVLIRHLSNTVNLVAKVAGCLRAILILGGI